MEVDLLAFFPFAVSPFSLTGLWGSEFMALNPFPSRPTHNTIPACHFPSSLTFFFLGWRKVYFLPKFSRLSTPHSSVPPYRAWALLSHAFHSSRTKSLRNSPIPLLLPPNPKSHGPFFPSSPLLSGCAFFSSLKKFLAHPRRSSLALLSLWFVSFFLSNAGYSLFFLCFHREPPLILSVSTPLIVISGHALSFVLDPTSTLP